MLCPQCGYREHDFEGLHHRMLVNALLLRWFEFAQALPSDETNGEFSKLLFETTSYLTNEFVP